MPCTHPLAMRRQVGAGKLGEVHVLDTDGKPVKC